MMKPTSSQQVENMMTNGVSQQVETDVAPHSSDSSVSVEILKEVTLDGN